MLARFRILVVLILLPVILGGLSTCRGGRDASPTVSAGLNNDAPPPAFAGLLPPPSEYTAVLETPRRAAYAEEDLIKHGADFVAGLPYPNASVDGDCLVFDPNWSEATGMGSENLSYCFYSFTVPGFDGTPQIRCGWRDPPADFSTVWIGQADWTLNSWQWYQAEEDDEIAVPSIGDSELLVIVHASATPSALGSIGLGPKQLKAELKITPESPWAPAELRASMTASAATIGSIDKYEVDWDGDWDFETDYGTESVGYQRVEAAGNSTAVGRITSSYYETATALDDYTVVEPWQHTWGLADEDRLLAVCTDGTEYCYAAGYVTTASNGLQLLMVKYSVDGAYQWARAWGADADDGANDVQYYDGKLYVAGYTGSFGAGGQDVLLQCWDTDGSVLWSEVWGTADDESGTCLAVTASHIYAGIDQYAGSSGSPYPTVLKCSLSGVQLWARGLDTARRNQVEDIAMTYDGVSGEYELHMVGVMNNTDIFNPTLLMYLKADEQGNLAESVRLWGKGSPNNLYATSITAFGNPPDVYVSGYIDTGTLVFDGVIVQLGWGSSCVGTSIKQGDTTHVPFDLLYLDGQLLACGVSYDTDHDLEDGFVASFSLAGDLIGGRQWDTGDHDGLYGLTSIPELGAILTGAGDSQQEYSWLPSGWGPEVCQPDSGTWTNEEGSLVAVSGSTVSPAAQSVAVTDGTQDTGGGKTDAAIVVYGIP